MAIANTRAQYVHLIAIAWYPHRLYDVDTHKLRVSPLSQAQFSGKPVVQRAAHPHGRDHQRYAGEGDSVAAWSCLRVCWMHTRWVNCIIIVIVIVLLV